MGHLLCSNLHHAGTKNPSGHAAAIDGLGIAFLPELQYRLAVNDHRLELILPDWGARDATLHVVHISRRGLLPSIRATVDFVAKALDLRSTAWAPD